MSDLIIIDVDPGLDDLRALVYGLLSKRKRIIAITTCSGNVLSPIASYNVGLVLGACYRSDIPVYQGITESYEGHILTGDKYYGENGVGDLVIPEQKFNLNKGVLAHRALVEYAVNFPKRITLCCMGPVTNLARAYVSNNSINNLFKDIFILGGDRAEKTKFNHSDYSEYNFFCDAKAVEIVFNNFGKINQTPVYLLDWTLCNKYTISATFFNSIADELSSDSKRKYQEAILRARSPIFYKSLPDDTIYLGDELALLCAYDPTIITQSHTVKLDSISLSEGTKGKTIFSASETQTYLIDQLDFERWKIEYRSIILKK